MNCAALNENLLDDEMFGHEDGAFTGAKGQRKGRFEYANGGTLFLDEIGDMPLSLQAKLLRVLENGEVVRIGANDPIKVDVRIVAATNRDLEKEVEGRPVPPGPVLPAEGRHDPAAGAARAAGGHPAAGAHFLKELAKRHGKPVPKVAPAVWKAFESYDWPGNVRELRNLLESMVVLDLDGVLTLDDLPEDAGVKPHGLPAGGSTAAGPDHLVGRPLAEVERYYMEKALELTEGNREEAAKMLGIGERTLYRKIQEWKKETEGATDQHG